LWAVIQPTPGTSFLTLLPPWHMYERSCEYFYLSRGCSHVYTNVKNLKVNTQLFEIFSSLLSRNFCHCKVGHELATSHDAGGSDIVQAGVFRCCPASVRPSLQVSYYEHIATLRLFLRFIFVKMVCCEITLPSQSFGLEVHCVQCLICELSRNVSLWGGSGVQKQLAAASGARKALAMALISISAKYMDAKRVASVLV
jgi:hypothetical protein